MAKGGWDGWREYDGPIKDEGLRPHRDQRRGVPQDQPHAGGHRGGPAGGVPAVQSGSGGPEGAQPAAAPRVKGARVCYVDRDARGIIEATLAKVAKRAGRQLERFSSDKEAKRYLVLLAEQDAGLIQGLRRQVKFPLCVKRPDGVEEMIASWACDFDYERAEACTWTESRTFWRRVVEDAKGHRTEMYKRSKKHVEAQYGIHILET
jgi:hypothetical protein